MSESKLSFTSSSSFRNVLLSKNLKPYTIEGAFTPPSNEPTYEPTISYTSVIDSPQIYNYGKTLYVLNQFGPSGGFNDFISFNGPPLPRDPNTGEYGFQNTQLPKLSEFYFNNVYNVVNIWSPEGGYDQLYSIGDAQLNNKIYQPYLPLTFIASTYNAYDILTSSSPSGSEGSLSSDSYLAKISASSLKFQLSENIAVETKKSINFKTSLNYLSNPSSNSKDFKSSNISGTNDYRITLLDENDTYLNKLQGTYVPSSPIPGDYFSTPKRNIGTIGQVVNLIAGSSTLLGGILSGAVNRIVNPSQIFLTFTGNFQKSTLFANLSFNIYRPAYGQNLASGLLGNIAITAVNSLIGGSGTQLPGAYYVGSVISEPSFVASPLTDIPINAFGTSIGAPVYGPSELSILYEGNENKLNFGLSVPHNQGKNIDGNFVWTSPKYSKAAGFFATPGGNQGTPDPSFNTNGVGTQYRKNESKDVTFKIGSILDDTQRIIDAADKVQGARRLKHVGTAINQVSKVFNDGYKEITKGSRIIAYTDPKNDGQLVGGEYCRVFTKDSPYYTNNRLQKSEGITTSNRRFSNSVLDNTYNLNIVPNKTDGTGKSTNIINGKIKKYMFSIENLAWRTSSRPGYTYDDLPVSEKGPNGGRIMWFPPYDISFSESSVIDFPGTSFLGRPEPIYTYKNTSRTGSISWKIIVDYPSTLDLIANNVLVNEKDSAKVDSALNSFFAGCLKYDIYELAAKYSQIPTNLLYAYQEILSNPRLTREELTDIANAQQTNNTSAANSNLKQTENKSLCDLNSYQGKGLFFDITNSEYYGDSYDVYVSDSNKESYKTKCETPESPEAVLNVFSQVVTPNFESVKNLITDCYDILSNDEGSIKITLESNLSPYEGSNPGRASEREKSVKDFISSYAFGDGKTLQEYVDNKKLTFDSVSSTGSVSIAGFDPENCNTYAGAGQEPESIGIYSKEAMACRSVIIKKIEVNPQPTDNTNNTVTNPAIPTADNPMGAAQGKITETKNIGTIKKGIAKKVIRDLLTESDYFAAIKQDNPFVYDSIREKIKYFHPSFHSMTPEGLNSRLTFLQQCTRPGETIPTIVDNKPKSNDATNTAFGAPPVLVLRIGDFYNTKIIPTNLQIAYDPLVLDLNPEGIGVQPMIAKITLTFNFIGGSGLANPINELQNALSFNYYGNTEIYDERATATESTEELDKQIVRDILENQPKPPEKPKTPQENPGGTTIGVQSNINLSGDTETGDLSYGKVMDSLVDSMKSYYNNIINQSLTITKNYNYGVLQLVCKDRLYIKGKIKEFNAPQEIDIFGKPNEIQEKLDDLFNNIINDIGNETNPIVEGLIDANFTSDSIEVRTLKQNLRSFVDGVKSRFNADLFKTIQEITTQEQNTVQIIRKLNLVDTKTDGKIDKTNTPIIYNITPTSEVHATSNGATDTYVEFVDDYTTIADGASNFNTDLTSEEIITDSYKTTGNLYYPTTFTLNEEPEQRFFMVMAQTFLNENNFNGFKNAILTDPLNVEGIASDAINNILNFLKEDFIRENDANLKIINDYYNGEFTKTYKDYKPFTAGKTRKFTYSTLPAPIDDQKTRLTNIYKTVNVNNDNATFDGKIQFN
jgi:hypothetical protein